MPDYNRLLQRQIRRNLKGVEIPAEFESFLNSVSDSFDHYEADRNMLERSLDISSGELNNANSKIKEALAEIEEKTKEIMDSINYAEGIQHSILPTQDQIKKYLKESFVLFRPKDIVSGDFYWMDVSQKGEIYFTAADCTGHGVPGALVSLVGANGLNRCLKEYKLTNPAEILDKLSQLVEETFAQRKDGMDAGLCKIYGNTLEYAGANNPLWLIRRTNVDLVINNQAHQPIIEEDGLKLYEVKANKQPVGSFMARIPFDNHTIQLQPADSIYVFSDGYPDQFGGPKGKKFMSKRLKKLLLSLNSKAMEEQKVVLDTTIQEWMAEAQTEQIDDICMIGVRN